MTAEFEFVLALIEAFELDVLMEINEHEAIELVEVGAIVEVKELELVTELVGMNEIAELL